MGHRTMSTESGLNCMDQFLNRAEVGNRGCGVFYDPKSRLFRLITTTSLYAFRITPRTNQIEHLYWGSRLNEEDELSFLSLNSVMMKSPFDPTSQAFVDVGQAADSPANMSSSDMWRIASRDARQPTMPVGTQQRLENMSWRQWGMETAGMSINESSALFRSPSRALLSSLSPLSDDSPSQGVSLDTIGEDDEAIADLETPRSAMLQLPSAAMLRTPSRALLSPRAAGMPLPSAGLPGTTQDIVGKNSLLLEFSDSGTGDYRAPSFRATARLSDITPVEYHAHRIFRGKAELTELEGGFLPTVRSESTDDCATVVVTLRDRVTGLEVDLVYTVYADFDVIVRRTEYRNTHSINEVVIEKAMASTNDFDGGAYTLSRLSGSWAREAQRNTHRLTPGIVQISSARGTSSHMHNPVAVISRDTFGEFSETSGSHWGFVLVYSGSFLIEVENSETGRVRVNCGFNPVNFKWKLGPGESVSTPEVILAFSETGVSALSNTYHRVINERVIAPQWRLQRAPVLVNTWEAMYFAVTRDSVLELAKYAVSIGAELLCIDDGWFAGRADDTSGLGDWEVDTCKIPLGLPNLCSELKQMGLAFGVWIEPEMVSPDSRMLQEHPQGILFAPGRPRSMRRNQFILDFTQAIIREAVLNKLRAILNSCNIEYVKWDMNRHLTEPNSVAMLEGKRLQGEVMHRHMLGVYKVLDTITREFPHVRFETCAGGGGRFDCGMLYFSPQIWASDNTDAACRARIQAGLSLVYPVNTMACHITESPNHQTGRSMPLSARSIVALFGAFGVELDLIKFSVQELGDLKVAVDKYKCVMDSLSRKRCKLVRLWDPFDSGSSHVYGAEVFAWMLVTDDQSTAVVAAGMLRLIEVGKIIPKLQIRGLHPNKNYRVKDLLNTRHVRDASTLKVVELPGAPVPRFKPLILPGRTLQHAGLPLQFLMDGDFVLLELSETQ